MAPANIVNAQLTIVRLWWTLRIRGGVAPRPSVVEESAPALSREAGAGSALLAMPIDYTASLGALDR